MIAKCEFQVNLFYISIYSARSKVCTIERDMNVPYIVYMPFKTLVRSIERALYNARIASSSFPLYNFVVGFLVGLFFAVFIRFLLLLLQTKICIRLIAVVSQYLLLLQWCWWWWLWWYLLFVVEESIVGCLGKNKEPQPQ